MINTQQQVEQAKEKVMKFTKTNPNPYCLLCGEITVNIQYSNTGKGLDDLLINHFKSIKNS